MATTRAASRSAIAALQTTRGERCITPESKDYDEARRVWNGLIDKRPAIIARCKGVADVVTALRCARQNDLVIAVRGGGHNVAGNASCDENIVIDLGPMNAVKTDAGARRVRAEAGANIGQVDRATQPFGLAVPLGVVTGTGIAGLTLCGGHSWITRKHGFACDNVTAIDLVTADGTRLRASADENADLFWAVRGGGGNFGIVTAFEYRAHAVGPQVTFCAAYYPIEDARRVLRLWRDHQVDAPDEFTSQAILWSIPAHENFPAELHGRGVVVITGVHCGPVDAGSGYIAPLRRLAKPLLDQSGPVPYLDLQQAFDPFFLKKGERLNFWKSLYLNALDDDAIDRIAARAAARPDPWALISIRHLGGVPARTPADISAFGGRDAAFMLSIDTIWNDPTNSAHAIAWTRDFWEEMRRGESGRAYLNFLGHGEDTDALMRASYGEANYERLVATKTKYDPTNAFRLNQNIPPRRTGGL
jgi:FAD/FMN-containing dehydrogenase